MLRHSPAASGKPAHIKQALERCRQGSVRTMPMIPLRGHLLVFKPALRELTALPDSHARLAPPVAGEVVP